jgi:hypothetical protein
MGRPEQKKLSCAATTISAIVMALACRCISSREDLILENLALRQQLLALHTHRPRRRLTVPHKLSCKDSAPDGGDLSFWLRPEPSLAGIGLVFACTLMALESKADGRSKACEPGGSCSDFSHGCGEPNLGTPRIHGELLKLGRFRVQLGGALGIVWPRSVPGGICGMISWGWTGGSLMLFAAKTLSSILSVVLIASTFAHALCSVVDVIVRGGVVLNCHIA